MRQSNNERAQEIKAEIANLKQQIEAKEQELKETGYNEKVVVTQQGMMYCRPTLRK